MSLHLPQGKLGRSSLFPCSHCLFIFMVIRNILIGQGTFGYDHFLKFFGLKDAKQGVYTNIANESRGGLLLFFLKICSSFLKAVLRSVKIPSQQAGFNVGCFFQCLSVHPNCEARRSSQELLAAIYLLFSAGSLRVLYSIHV